MANPKVITHWDSVYNGRHSKIQDSVPDAARFLVPFKNEMGRKKILDIGCGDGTISVFCAQQGADVLGIDISENGVLLTLENAQANHPKIAAAGGHVSAERIDALDIDKFEGTPFQFVVGRFILHHIEPFNVFAEKLSRVTADNGTLVFYENSANNKLLMFFRTYIVGHFGVPCHGDGVEVPLMESEIDELRKYFDVKIVIPKLVFFSLIGEYLIRFETAKRFFKAMDDFCFRHFHFMHHWSYNQILIMRKTAVSK